MKFALQLPVVPAPRRRSRRADLVASASGRAAGLSRRAHERAAGILGREQQPAPQQIWQQRRSYFVVALVAVIGFAVAALRVRSARSDSGDEVPEPDAVLQTVDAEPGEPDPALAPSGQKLAAAPSSPAGDADAGADDAISA